MSSFSDLVGQRIESFYCNSPESFIGAESILIKTDRATYKMFHSQDCCESVFLEEIHGDFEDLIGEIVISADESTSDYPEGPDYLNQWTFYTIRTNKATVTLRWLGSSNGYYSVDVSFERVSDEA